ncbi:MAG: pyridoxal phosphate-dependent aminotransferase [Archangiaceae bacterium]|nr:pyridoxal phosphate-dependent aminotransferase [Archangiaceae bacterium]
MRESAFQVVELTENSLAARRSELEANGVELLDLTVSNPTAVGLAPTGVALPAVDRYEPEALGTRAAREAVGSYAGVSAEALLLCASTSEAYGWLFKLLGGEVWVPAPGYPLLEHLAALEHVALRHYPLRYDGRWCTDAALVAGTAQTRAVVAVSPGNPTGSYLLEHEARPLAELCAARGWALIVDEVFCAPSRSLASRAWPCLTFCLGGLSKACGLPQLKLAWTSVHGPGAARALEQLGLIADTYLSVGAPVQAAAGQLLSLAPGFQARVRARCDENRRALSGVMRPEWQLLGAEGGWSAVVRLPSSVDEEALCLRLLEAGVVVHPGFFYDFPSGKHLVLSLLPLPDVFVAGVAALAGL